MMIMMTLNDDNDDDDNDDNNDNDDDNDDSDDDDDDTSLSEYLFREIVDELSVNETGDTVVDDLLALVTHLGLFCLFDFCYLMMMMMMMMIIMV